MLKDYYLMESKVVAIENDPANFEKAMESHDAEQWLESTHEHSSEPRKYGELFFKFGQYCPHFLENSMNIRVYA
jgi:hypothetical protein